VSLLILGEQLGCQFVRNKVFRGKSEKCCTATIAGRLQQLENSLGQCRNERVFSYRRTAIDIYTT
jgi:hypothetical protein